MYHLPHKRNTSLQKRKSTSYEVLFSFSSRGAEKDALFSEIFCPEAKCEIMCPSTL